VALINTVFWVAMATAFFRLAFLLIQLIWLAVRLSHMLHVQVFYTSLNNKW